MWDFLSTIQQYQWDIIIFFWLISIFLFSRYLLRANIEKKEHNKNNDEKQLKQSHKKQDLYVYGVIFFTTCTYFAALFFQIGILQNIVTFVFSLSTLYLISLFFQRKILLIYGEEVEVSGQQYFKKWYKVSIFSLFVNVVAIIIGLFLLIKIFNIDSLVEIGGLWAGILAFMWFTAPVWALDMIAWIILLQSKNFETGNVYYIYEQQMYVWIKTISLTEVKCIDLRYGNPIMFRPSQFRNLTLKNLSHWISWKSSKILREKELFVDYSFSKEQIEKVCYPAFDQMLKELETNDATNYFGDDHYISLEIDDFSNYAVKYKLFYTITSPFYIFKAERLFNEYLFRHQQDNNIYFSTPDLLQLEKKAEKKELI